MRKRLVTLLVASFLVIGSSGAVFAKTTIKFVAAKFVETLAMAELGKQIAEKEGLGFEVYWLTFDNTRDKLILDFKGGSTDWDIVYVDSKWVPEFAKLGLVTPIETLVKTTKVPSSLLALDDYIDIHMERQRFNGKTWTLPILAAYNALVYRKDLFDSPIEQAAFEKKYGYKLVPPQTYKQFRDVAEFFTRKKGEKLNGEVLTDDFYGCVHSNKRGDFLWHDYLNVLVAFGGDIVFNPKTMQPTWNSPASIAAAKYYKELTKFQPPGNINMTSGEATSLFANGHVAMQVEFLNRLVDTVENKQTSSVVGKTGYVLPPSQDGVKDRAHAFIVNTNGMGIYSLSKHKDEAFRLLAQILSKQGQKQMMLNNPGYLPTRESVWSDTELVSKYPVVTDFVKLVSKTKPYTFKHPQIPEYPQAAEIASNSIADVLAGEDVEGALNRAQQSLVELFKRAGYIKVRH